MKFRDLTKDEIDVRVGQVGDGWATLLLYKDARVDMDILDETAGSENWQRRHYEVKGNMYCSVGIKCGGEWIWKDDCGTESNTEKEKGESSDSFKRACVNWGIGRELYTSPKILIRCETEGKKIKALTDFAVSEIETKEKQIVFLCISAYSKATKQRIIVFDWTCGKAAKTPQEPAKSPEIIMTLEEAKKLKTRSGLELERLMDGQLKEFVKCQNATYSIAAQMILDERAKEEQRLTEMAENKLPWEE